ncbi:hypothetical protein GCM10010271_12590 [Streptomyces kurssanovii]|nr:hypothetical protein GCM10010271_12590 [Streptomyces kurssanovii]
MKQSAAKTLGVAALGAAFAAAAAGTASATPAVPDPTGALGNVSTTLPLNEVTEKLPAGAGAVAATTQGAVAEAVPAGAADPVSGLLGGLPLAGGGPLGALGGLTGGLPIGG